MTTVITTPEQWLYLYDKYNGLKTNIIYKAVFRLIDKFIFNLVQCIHVFFKIERELDKG